MPSSDVLCEQERNYRTIKCARLLQCSGDVVDIRMQDRLRRIAVYPGLPAEQRADVWKLFLKLLTPMRAAWSFTEQQRRESYESMLEVCHVTGDREPEQVLNVFMFYSTMDCSRAATSDSPKYHSTGKGNDTSALSMAELESLRAMHAVLKGVFVNDYQIFWCLVMLRNQQNRIVLSQNGTMLQRYSASHRVLAFAKHLAVVDPELSSLLERKFMILPSMYADKWFRSLFALPFGQERVGAVIRVWDALIASPFELVVHVAVHLTLRMKPALQAIYARTSDSAPALRLLETLPEITEREVDDILHTIWHDVKTLFRRGNQLSDLEDRISFSIEWPVVRFGAVNSTLVKILQFLLRARGLRSIFFVGESNVGAPSLVQPPVPQFFSWPRCPCIADV
jgi:Rab-GTPase-TBC domain